MKTIAIVTNTSWNILNFRTSLIEELKQEFNVILIAPQDDSSVEIQKIAPTYFLKKLSRKGTNPITELQLINELKQLYKQHKVDLALHFTIKPNIYGSIAAGQIGIPSISVVTGLGYTFLSNGIAAKMAKFLYKYAFQRNSLTIFQNKDDEQLFHQLKLAKQGKTTVIDGSGIDIDYFSPIEMPSSPTFKFLFVGRLLYDKGIQELFDAFTTEFNQNKQTELHIVGDVDNDNPSAYSQQDLDAILAKHKNIIYHGRVNAPKQLIAESNCVVLPSYREGLPRVMLEAIAMAKPVITTNTAGCKEITTNNNGLLVPIKNATELGLAMKQMATLPTRERTQLGKNGRELAKKRFSARIVNKTYIKQIKALL